MTLSDFQVLAITNVLNYLYPSIAIVTTPPLPPPFPSFIYHDTLNIIAKRTNFLTLVIWGGEVERSKVKTQLEPSSQASSQ